MQLNLIPPHYLSVPTFPIVGAIGTGCSVDGRKGHLQRSSP
jgi:hypothetical protein